MLAVTGITLTTCERGEGDNTPIWHEWESLGKIPADFYTDVCSLIMYHIHFAPSIFYARYRNPNDTAAGLKENCAPIQPSGVK